MNENKHIRQALKEGDEEEKQHRNIHLGKQPERIPAMSMTQN